MARQLFHVQSDIQELIEEVTQQALSLGTPPETTERLKIIRHTLTKVLEYSEDTSIPKLKIT